MIKQLMDLRIATKGIRARDVHHPGRLTTAQIASIDPATVFCWIRTGEWKFRHFKMWLDASQQKVD